MDVLKALEEKSFWGMEFLTWLWFRSEERNGEMELPNKGVFTLWVQEHLVLESLQSESKQNTLRSGDVANCAEAAAALGVGKKVTKARFGLRRGDFEWSFAIDARTFDILAMKIPEVMPDEEDDPVEATLLIRMGHIRDCLDVIDGLFAEFCALRLSGDWDDELVKMQAWVAAKPDKSGF